jgi:hypothetical protein
MADATFGQLTSALQSRQLQPGVRGFLAGISHGSPQIEAPVSRLALPIFIAGPLPLEIEHSHKGVYRGLIRPASAITEMLTGLR